MVERAAILIVGGGPAGLVTALALLRADARRKDHVIVLERARYPRDKYCAGAVGGRGERILQGLDASPDVPSVPISGMSFRGVDGERSARVGPIGRVIRRVEFDHALAEIARARGVRIVEGALVERVDVEGARATVTTRSGSYQGEVIVGADGVGSVVRRAMGLGRGALLAQVLELDTESVPADRDRDLVHFDASDRGLTGYFWDFPTRVGGADLVCRGVYHLRTGELGSGDRTAVDLGQRLGARLAAMGLSIDRYENKRFSERGLAGGEVLTRGPLVLVGEAAGIDPVTGEGIAQAIEYGALAGRFLAGVLRGERKLSEWTSCLRASRLGLDLRLRRRVVHSFFGPNRPALERMLATRVSAVRSGSRHFGGLPPSVTDLAVVGAGVARIFLGSRLSRLASR